MVNAESMLFQPSLNVSPDILAEASQYTESFDPHERRKVVKILSNTAGHGHNRQGEELEGELTRVGFNAEWVELTDLLKDYVTDDEKPALDRLDWYNRVSLPIQVAQILPEWAMPYFNDFSRRFSKSGAPFSWRWERRLGETVKRAFEHEHVDIIVATHPSSARAVRAAQEAGLDAALVVVAYDPFKEGKTDFAFSLYDLTCTGDLTQGNVYMITQDEQSAEGFIKLDHPEQIFAFSDREADGLTVDQRGQIHHKFQEENVIFEQGGPSHPYPLKVGIIPDSFWSLAENYFTRMLHQGYADILAAKERTAIFISVLTAREERRVIKNLIKNNVPAGRIRIIHGSAELQDFVQLPADDHDHSVVIVRKDDFGKKTDTQSLKEFTKIQNLVAQYAHFIFSRASEIPAVAALFGTGTGINVAFGFMEVYLQELYEKAGIALPATMFSKGVRSMKHRIQNELRHLDLLNHQTQEVIFTMGRDAAVSALRPNNRGIAKTIKEISENE